MVDYYKSQWNNCNRCRIHYMSEEPHLKAYLCDECWNTLPHFKVGSLQKRKIEQTLDAPMSDWPISWILLYTTGCITCVLIIAYYLVFK